MSRKSRHETKTTQNHICFTDRRSSATNLTVPPESTCLHIKEHKSCSPQQQHLLTCGDTLRYKKKVNMWSRQGCSLFSHTFRCSLHPNVLHLRCCLLGCKRTSNGGQKLAKRGSQQIHNVVLNWAGHACCQEQEVQEEQEQQQQQH